MLRMQYLRQRFARSLELGDTNARSLVKTICWRITGSGATFLIAYLMIGNFAIAGTIGMIQLVSNTILYYVHERIWNKIPWGKNESVR
jgi:uncharacterized membrane protein